MKTGGDALRVKQDGLSDWEAVDSADTNSTEADAHEDAN